MVGSRCSMAVTAAWTNPSKSDSISRYRRLFFVSYCGLRRQRLCEANGTSGKGLHFAINVGLS